MNTGTNDQPLQPLPITMTTELGPQSSQKESVPASPQTEKLFKSTVLGKKVKDQKKVSNPISRLSSTGLYLTVVAGEGEADAGGHSQCDGRNRGQRDQEDMRRLYVQTQWCH